MNSRLPRWLLITLISVAVVVVIAGLVMLTLSANPVLHWLGWGLIGVLIVGLAIVIMVVGPPLLRWYKFNKYFKKHEAQLHLLPTLLEARRTQEALVRFEGVMKHAPENAYIFYMRAFFLQAAGKLPEAMAAATKALTMVDRDPFLPAMLQQVGGQTGQPTTVEGFREQLRMLIASLEPRVDQMRQRREKAVTKRKKKSR